MSYTQSKMSNRNSYGRGRFGDRRRRDQEEVVKEEKPARKEPPGPTIDPRTGKKDWSLYNATVVGNTPLVGAPAHPKCLPGLEDTQGSGRRLGCGRPYSPAEDGPNDWVHVPTRQERVERKRIRSRRRHAQRALQQEQEAVRMEIDDDSDDGSVEEPVEKYTSRRR